MNARFYLVAGGLALVGYALYTRYKGGSSSGDALATSGGAGSTSFAPTEGRASAPILGGDSILPSMPVTPGESSPTPVGSNFSEREQIQPVRITIPGKPTTKSAQFFDPLEY